jgi:hypothetical protein
VIRPTFQPATTSIAFLFRNHTLWDLNHHTSNSLESQQPMDMKHCPSSAGICHRHFCRFFSDRTDVQIRDFSAILARTNPRGPDRGGHAHDARSVRFVGQHESGRRPSFRNGPSARMSKGFLFVATRLTSLRVRFKDSELRISRRKGIFERDQNSAAFWLQSNKASAVSATFPAGSLRLVTSCSTVSTSRFSSVVLPRNTLSSTDPER